MIHTNRPLPSRETASVARRRHASDFSDAVVAAYIHDISARRSRLQRAVLPLKPPRH